MNHGDVACHFDLECSVVFLDMKLERLVKIFQRIAESRADGGLSAED
jgi:hypothetical protein